MAIVLMCGKHSISSSNIDLNEIEEHIDNNDLHISNDDRLNLNSIKHNKGTFQNESELRATYPTSNAGDYCVCYNGTNYTVWTYFNDWVDTGTQSNVQSVNSMMGDVVLDSSNINYDTGITMKTEIDRKLNNDDIIYATFSEIDALF